MSHPDPLYDEENTMSQDSFDRFDDMAERTIYPWIDDESHDNSDELTAEYFLDRYDGVEQDFEDDYDDNMDGDFDSAMRDAGMGTDEDYGYFGGEDW
jgi:hypothetical protein